MMANAVLIKICFVCRLYSSFFEVRFITSPAKLQLTFTATKITHFAINFAFRLPLLTRDNLLCRSIEILFLSSLHNFMSSILSIQTSDHVVHYSTDLDSLFQVLIGFHIMAQRKLVKRLVCMSFIQMFRDDTVMLNALFSVFHIALQKYFIS